MRWKLQPPLLAGIILVVATGLHVGAPAVPLPDFRWPGWLLLVAGVFITGWARIVFVKESATLFVGDAPSRLVCQGPFRFSRNPMYVGITVCCLSLGLILNSAYFLAGAIAFFAVIAVAYVPFEEKRLREAFGRDYADYCRKVRRWI
jgi:protein-S-isoprenylcysteine O-methyltransferase Ste14